MASYTRKPSLARKYTNYMEVIVNLHFQMCEQECMHISLIYEEVLREVLETHSHFFAISLILDV